MGRVSRRAVVPNDRNGRPLYKRGPGHSRPITAGAVLVRAPFIGLIISRFRAGPGQIDGAVIIGGISPIFVERWRGGWTIVPCTGVDYAVVIILDGRSGRVFMRLPQVVRNVRNGVIGIRLGDFGPTDSVWDLSTRRSAGAGVGKRVCKSGRVIYHGLIFGA